MGFLVIQPGGAEFMSPKQLLTELGSNIAAALLAAFVLTQVRSGYVGRVVVVTLMGVFGFVSINISYWNWYGFPTDFTIGAALDEIIGWFLGGLVLAAIVRPAKIQKVAVPEGRARLCSKHSKLAVDARDIRPMDLFAGPLLSRRWSNGFLGRRVVVDDLPSLGKLAEDHGE